VQALLGDSPDPKVLEDLSNQNRVTAQTPPTFIFSTSEDITVPSENSVEFYLALHKVKVPAELHIFQKGPHGVGLALGRPALDAWPTLLVNWMRGLGLLDK
jgi:dipeptidyl aminopeptidase/acylaminoacyl peptidase